VQIVSERKGQLQYTRRRPASLLHVTIYDDTTMTALIHPLLALIASATNSQLAKYVEFLKGENKILRARLTSRPFL